MKTIQLNGEEYSTAASSLVELLEALKIPLSTVLLELNGTALLRHELEKAPLNASDHIEILKVVAGG